MSNFENMPVEQQQYTLTSSASKTLYEARQLSKELQSMALTPDTDPLVLAQTANALEKMIETGANQVYAVKKNQELQHPHFKEQAKKYALEQEHVNDYARRHEHIQDIDQEQSF